MLIYYLFSYFLSLTISQQQRLNDEDEKLVQELYGGEDGVFVKRIAEPDDDEYSSDFESEDAMRSLLVEKVEGVCL